MGPKFATILLLDRPGGQNRVTEERLKNKAKNEPPRGTPDDQEQGGGKGGGTPRKVEGGPRGRTTGGETRFPHA